MARLKAKSDRICAKAFSPCLQFIDVQFGSWHYPTFNVADAAICIGAGLLMIDLFLSKKHAKAADPKTEAAT